MPFSNHVSPRAIDSKGYEFHGRDLSISLFPETLTVPACGNIYQMVGFPLTPFRLRICPTLGTFLSTVAMLFQVAVRMILSQTRSELIPAIVTPGRTPVKEVEINF